LVNNGGQLIPGFGNGYHVELQMAIWMAMLLSTSPAANDIGRIMKNTCSQSALCREG
jgi:hypothetical protein